MISPVYSGRQDWQQKSNRLSGLLKDKTDYLDLTISNPTKVGLPPSDLPDLKGCELPSYTPEALGLQPAREAIADYYAQRDRTVSPDHIVLCASTSEAYSWLFKLLCDPGCNVLAPRPSYPLFDELAALDAVKLRPYQFQYTDRWHLDQGAIAEAKLPSTRAVLVVNPNNPTGTFLASEDVEHLSAANLPLIVDEVFADYAFNGGFDASMVGWQEGLNFVLSGLSKVCGLPGLKLSWIVVQGPDEQRQEALARLERIADTYLSVNSPVQMALPQILQAGATTRNAIRERVAANRKTVEELGLDVLETDGGWYAIIRTARDNDEDLAVALVRNSGVLTHPGYFYDMPMDGCLVISLLPDPVVFREGLDRISSALR